MVNHVVFGSESEVAHSARQICDYNTTILLHEAHCCYDVAVTDQG